MTQPSTVVRRAAPALVLAFLAPLMAEVLPGATRLSSLFVFPIEMAVWGGGAVLIRALVRRRGLGWWSLGLLGLALAVAEEWLIQQTSLAPMVIELKGEEWGRGLGINYVYFLWALVYETVWVVLLPVLLTEMLFAQRRREVWLSRGGAVAAILLFAAGSALAWFSWTHIARVQVFHVPLYTPPIVAVAVAIVAIILLAVTALSISPGRSPRRSGKVAAWRVGLAAASWAILWYGLVLLAFGIAPSVPPAAAVGTALIVVAVFFALLRRWAESAHWGRAHDFALLLGALVGSMAVSFIGFLGSAPLDLAFKIAVDAAALAALLLARAGS